MTAYVGFAEFDTQAQPSRAHVGWAEFDALAGQSRSYVGWASFDTADAESPVSAQPPEGLGGGADRNGGSLMSGKHYSSTRKQYNIPISNVDESEEEEVLMQILMEIAKNEFI